MTTTVEDEPKVETNFLKDLSREMDAARLAERTASTPQTAPGSAPMPSATPAQPPAPPTPPTPPEAAPSTSTPEQIDAEIEAGKRTPKSEDWKRLKEGFKKSEETYKGTISNYEKELAELKKEPKHNAKLIEELTQERDRYKAIHDSALLEWSPDFNAKYTKRTKSVIEGLKPSLPADRAEKIVQILEAPGTSELKHEKLVELTADMNEFTRAEVANAFHEMNRIQRERAAELSSADETLKGIVEHRQAESKARQEAAARAFQETVKKAKEAMPLMQERDGDSAWNEDLKARTAVAQAIFNGDFKSDEQRADASLWASNAPLLLKQLSSSQAEIASLKDAIAKLQGSTPAIKGDTSGKPGQVQAGGGFIEGFNSALKEVGSGG